MNEDEKEKYLLIAKTPRFKRLVAKTHEIISEALELSKDFYLSYSSGKDSTVLLDLLSHHEWSNIAFHAIASKYEDPQENIDLSIKSEQKYGVKIHRIKCFGEYDAWNSVGYFFINPQSKEEKMFAKKANDDFKEKAKQFSQQVELPNRFMGITKAESVSREINIATRGRTYQLKDGSWVSNPLADWKNEDIWAYIVANKLSYLSVYDKQLFQPRELIRNELTVLYQSSLMERKILIMYQYAYPQLFAELVKEFPSVRAYV